MASTCSSTIWCWKAFGYRFPNFDLTMANTSNSHFRVCTKPGQVQSKRRVALRSLAFSNGLGNVRLTEAGALFGRANLSGRSIRAVSASGRGPAISS
jgi:hypothetical protein